MTDTIKFDIKNGVLYSLRLLEQTKELILPNEIRQIEKFGLDITSNSNDFNKYIEKIYIPASVVKCNADIFKGFVNLKEIILDEPSKCFKLMGKNLFSKDGKVLYLAVKDNDINYDIPLGVEIISAYAFDSCNKIANLNCPETVKSYGDYCFANMSKLTNIKLPHYGCFDSFNEGIFSNCSSLKEILIPKNISIIPDKFLANCICLEKIMFQDNKINYIGKNAFDTCESLTKLDLPESIKCIEKNAFKDCKELVELTIKALNIELVDNPFIGCNKICLFIPANGSLEKLATKYNLRFYNI